MPIPNDIRESRILAAALESFSKYGFARTRMDDIAQASQTARTALYKTYRNKEHIFRALAELVHEQALDAARLKLMGDGDFRQCLEDALIARDMHLLKIGHAGPHADEIAELYLSLAGDLADRFSATFVTLLEEAANLAITSGDYELPAAFDSEKNFAELLHLALEGVKRGASNIDKYESLARQLIKSMTV